MTKREIAIMNEAFMVGRVYANMGEKESPAEIQKKLEAKCKQKADVEQRQETASEVDTIVSVPELLSLAEMVREQPKVDKMLGDNGAFAKVREQVYNECAGFIEQLAKGDKSVIEKM